MLFVCIMLLFLPLISANAFYFHALSLFIDTYFAYLFFLFASCTVLLICLIFLIICSHRCCCCFFNIFLYERAMSSPEKYHLKITIIIIKYHQVQRSKFSLPVTATNATSGFLNI